jgi:RNA polymerase sigma factor (sigma-70 family)
LNSDKLYEVISGCKQNDRHSQKLLFELYAKKMMGVCLRYSPNYETARDMVQDGFVKIFTKINSFKGDSSIETWMTRICINTCLSNLNKAENKNQFYDINDPVIQQKTELNPDNEEVFEDSIRSLPVEKILDYMNQLPDKYRLVINMYSVDGLSHQQISDELNIQIGSSKSRLSRARALLIEIIKEKENL